MILVFFFASVLLSCLSHLHTMAVCPKSFDCSYFSTPNYPFHNTTDTQCGLIKIDCTSDHENIQVGNRSYDILDVKDSFWGPSFSIRNKTFEALVNDKSCEALTNNFTSPTPGSFLIDNFTPLMTLFKCTKDPHHAAHSYFQKLDYNSYNNCSNTKFYYNKHPTLDTPIPSDLPSACEVIRLPMVSWLDVANETNIFSYLTPNFTIHFVSPSCVKCYRAGGHHCNFEEGNFRCPESPDDKEENRRLILILVLFGAGFILMLFSVIFIIRYQRKRNPFSYVSSKDKTTELEDSSFFYGASVFSYTELKDATRNFDPSQELGDGGFGAVYYGKLQDGREVAVKRLYENNYKRVKHFINEVKILTKLRHPNLVVLYGCTSRECRELLLVYEYIPNGTVADHLHGRRANPSLLTWPIRMKIAIETASALVYLHASEIIHRDVKTNNILLDDNFCVKVADFGLSRPLPNDVTHVSTAPQGTPGYLDPEYHNRYQLTEKSDVYSFGVVLIELISSMVAVDLNRSQEDISLANLAINRIQRRAMDELIDPVLGSDTDTEIMRMVTSVAELAFRCLQYESEMRPTMNEVLDVLEEIQAEGRTDARESVSEMKTTSAPHPSENLDAVVLLKDFLRSPVSVAGEWQSDSSRSTTLTIGGNSLPMKNHISI